VCAGGREGEQREGEQVEEDKIAVSRFKLKKKSKAIPVLSHGGLQGCELSWIPHFLDKWLTDDK
jgi:hypothetical protein